MKRRIIAALMALCLCIGLLPATALAAEGPEVTGEGPYDGLGTNLVYFHIGTTDIYKMAMLKDSSVTAKTDIDSVKINFTGESRELTNTDPLDNKIYSAYWHNILGIQAQKANPSDLVSVEISYEEKSVTLNANELRLIGDHPWTNATGLYHIQAKDSSRHIVAFYDSRDSSTGDDGIFWLYHVAIVDNNSTVTNWPKNPEYISYTFGNWSTEKEGGSQFTQATVVNADTEAFAQKLSGVDVHAGTRIRIMNENDAILTRYVELYNAENDPDITINDINRESVKIAVHGTNGSTNPDYFVSEIDHNGWEDGYYLVFNRNADEIDPDSQLHNTHVPYTEVQSIEIFASLNGSSDVQSVTINKGTACGDFSTVIDQNDMYWNFTIKAPPTAPDDEDLTDDPDVPDDTAILGKGAVTVDCINNKAEHDPVTYGLIPGSYTAPTDEDVYWANDAEGNGAYYVDITIEDENYDTYVTRYDTDIARDETHTVVAGEDESKTITLKYEGSGWTVPTGAIPVTIDVACGTDPTLPAEEHIWVEVYLDGQKVNNEALNLVTFVAPADDLVWDADNLRYTLDLGNDHGNVTFNLPAPSEGTRDYLLRAIVADLVYAASGTAPNMGENAATEDPDDYQITSIMDQSTLKIYLGQEYTVVYSVPPGYESQVTADTNTYIIAQTWPGTSMDYPTTEGDFRDDCLWENPSVTTAPGGESLKTAIMLHPTISGLTGWSIDGTTYSSPVQVSAVAGEADENHVITFTATTSGNPPSGPADITVTKDLTKVGTIDITSSTTEIPSAKEDDVIEWTITVENVGGETQTTNVTITENLTGALITDPQNTHVTVNDNVITVKGLEANESVTITVTYTVTAADVEAGTAIKNSVTVDDGDGDAPETVEPDEDVPVVEADILDDPVIFHSVNGSTFETTDARQDTADNEHLVTTTDPAISYQAVLDLSAMELQNTSNTNQGFGSYTIYSIMNDDPWGKLTSSYWNLLDHDDTIINLCVKFDSQLDVTETAMQNVTVTSPYFERTGDPVTFDSTTGYWKIPCQAKAQVNTTGYTNPDEVILSGITLNLTSAAQSALNTSKVLTLTSGGYIDGTVTFGGTLSALNPLTVYGEATDDVVNLALDAWDDGDNTETGGDGTPDYQQALIKYVSANTSYGTVNPATEVVTLTGMTGNTGTATNRKCSERTHIPRRRPARGSSRHSSCSTHASASGPCGIEGNSFSVCS